MKQERISVGEFVFPYFSKPDWAETKLKYWPWIVFLAGAALALKVGLGLPVKFKAEFPFVEWEEGKVTEINATALAFGGGLMLVGLVCSLKILRKRDDEKDGHWPEVKADYVPRAAVLFMESPTIVDAARVDAVLKEFGRDWPSMTIRWPRSSQRLIEEGRDVMGAQHKLDLADHSAQLAFGQLQRSVDSALAMRDKCAAALPAVVRRCADLPLLTTSRAIQRLLVLINYRAHYPLFTALVTLKSASADIATPKIWDSLFGKSRTRETLYQVDNPLTVKRAILVGIGDSPVFTAEGSVVTVEGQGYDVRHRVSVAEASPNVLAEIEACIIDRGGELPDRYKGELLFSKIGPARSTWLPGDGDVSVDPELEAVGEKYRLEWRLRHSADPACP
jgi:hypothetical protein